ncbi:MAG: hypothetical protein ACPG19_11210 [Saprospiraceae bacterium]
MQEQDKHLNTLTEIRDLMERSSRFISLSGLTGVAAGIFALIGAWVAYYYAGISFSNEFTYNERFSVRELELFLLADGLVILIFALGFGVFFTARKAKKAGLKVWDKTTERMLINLMLPLVTGGIFCLILIFKWELIGFVAPVTLLFYGMALINASKYTFHDIRYLGVSEVILGLIGSYFIGYGLLIWAIGFGVLHIVYGLLMYYKYER